ncbi:MAG TPA: hypothetical protein VK512_10265 [Xanthobacteraceae bacterium]|jgi:hypothetical protein|nr:hypothetical protein [Xanthobacteraceae bacterium]
MISLYVDNSVLYPDDLVMLRRVFDQVCADGCYETNSVEAELIAAALLNIFQNGTSEEALLLAELRSRRQDFILKTG